MKSNCSLMCCLICLVTTGVLGADETVPCSELGKSVHVIGRLGKELGTLVHITVVATGKQPRAKDRIFVFEIIMVDGQRLDEPVTMALTFDSSWKDLPGEGNIVAKYAGYESGSFVGVPEAISKETDDAEAVKPSQWRFQTNFKVVKTRDTRNE